VNHEELIPEEELVLEVLDEEVETINLSTIEKLVENQAKTPTQQNIFALPKIIKKQDYVLFENA
jgi:hypothetical protein